MYITIQQFRGVYIDNSCKQQLKCCSNYEVVLEWVEDTVEDGENIANQHFLILQQCFLKTSFSWPLKVLMM